MDLLATNGAQPRQIPSPHPTVKISAATGWNIDALIQRIQTVLIHQWPPRPP